METIFIDTLKEKINISKKELAILVDSFQPISKQKNEFLVNEGGYSPYLYFVIDGFVRNFYLDEGVEITTRISVSKDFVTSFDSFLNNTPSNQNIQCISNCSLLRISKDDYQRLYKEVSNWSLFCKGVYEDHILRITDRANSLQNLSATERYLKILKTNPDIALNVAVKHLASYLGIKPQSLSRIRKDVIK